MPTNENAFDLPDIDIAWCPGCGDFAILNAVKEALAELELTPQGVVFVSGIGQAAKLPHYLRANFFNGLHGRGLPAATAIKAANPELVVIEDSGDGCTYGEGGNHFIHAIRRNPDLTCIVHNNMVYGLTKGQASPTSAQGFRTPVQPGGVILEPFNPIAVAVALDASFVARSFAGDHEHLVSMLKQAILHKGFALVDVFQPCVSFNRVNSYQWFREHTYKLEDGYNPEDRMAAFGKALEQDPMPLGVIYRSQDKRTFEDSIGAYQDDPRPLYRRELDRAKVAALIAAQRP